MTRVLLIRHGLHLLGGDRIAGRRADVHLSPQGQVESEGLVGRLAGIEIEAIYSSPIDRTIETAQPLASDRGLSIQPLPGAVEIDYGDWTGSALDDLRGTPDWTNWNAFRSGQRVPNGESMMEVQSRIISTISELCGVHGDGIVAVFSHGDVIKAAVAHYLGAPLDLFHRMEISTASVSAVNVTELGPHVLCVNDTGSLARLPGLG